MHKKLLCIIKMGMAKLTLDHDELYNTMLFYSDLLTKIFGRTKFSVKRLVQWTKTFGNKIFRGGPNFSEKNGLVDKNFQ